MINKDDIQVLVPSYRYYNTGEKITYVINCDTRNVENIVPIALGRFYTGRRYIIKNIKKL